jgi:hypothetical protein
LILISSAFAFFVVFLLRQNDEDLAEERDEVEEQVKRVVDEVAVASFVARDDQLSVVANEARHDADAAVKEHVLDSSAENTCLDVFEKSSIRKVIFFTKFCAKS